MPDINHTLVATPFVAGETLDANRVAEGLYKPQSTPTNMAVMNGFLDEENLATPYTVDYRLVRPRAFATAKSVGHTANLDFFSDFFEGTYDPTNYTETQERALTAVGIRFYVPYDCSVVMLTWHVGLLVDGQHLQTEALGLVEDTNNRTETAPRDTTGVLGTALAWRGGGVTERSNTTLLSLFLDGEVEGTMNRQIYLGKNSLAGSKYVTSTGNRLASLSDGAMSSVGINRVYWNHSRFPDHRWWSGHFNVSSGDLITKGWHTASIRVTNGKWDYNSLTQADGTARTKVAPHVRFKTCRFTAIPIR